MAVQYIVVHAGFGSDTHGASEVDVKGFATKEDARAYVVAHMTEDLNEQLKDGDVDDQYAGAQYKKIQKFASSGRDNDEDDRWEIREIALEPKGHSSIEQPEPLGTAVSVTNFGRVSFIELSDLFERYGRKTHFKKDGDKIIFYYADKRDADDAVRDLGGYQVPDEYGQWTNLNVRLETDSN